MRKLLPIMAAAAVAGEVPRSGPLADAQVTTSRAPASQLRARRTQIARAARCGSGGGGSRNSSNCTVVVAGKVRIVVVRDKFEQNNVKMSAVQVEVLSPRANGAGNTPHWFREEAFLEPDFDADTFIADLRRYVSSAVAWDCTAQRLRSRCFAGAGTYEPPSPSKAPCATESV